MGIQDDGGWLHDDIVDHFADYARVAFSAFGDRVKFWLSFNEPQIFCNAKWNYGASRDTNPFEEPPVKPYICSHNVVKAHAKAWRIYDEMFRSVQNGQMGIALNCDWYEPKDRSDPEHIAAMERALHFKFGWWAHPLTSGKYPPVMRELVDAKSNISESRLPIFDEEWTEIINGRTVDFLGLNHYGTQYVLPSDGSNGGTNGDANIRTEGDPAWNKSGIGWNVVPYGFRNILTWIHEEYKLPIYVTENGYGDLESVGLDDPGRQNYYRGYINEMLKSIKFDHADVRGYTAWTLLDNFEWEKGYTVRFGVHYVDFNNPDRPRTPKGSAKQLAKIFADNGFRKEDNEFLYGRFPDGFVWGLATSAYQIEGGWDAGDKGENSWDFWTHQNDGANIADSKNGDIACDSYHKYLDDVKLLKDIGANFYRFSLSWSRIIPTGKIANGVSFAGIDYYNKLIDALLAEGISPFITLYHWDTPMGIQNDGGWLHDDIVDHFADYARVAFSAFGDRVKLWLTFNEPYLFCLNNWNYGETSPFQEPPVKPYICSHNVIKAHAKAWRIYDEEFRATQNGQMGITLLCNWPEPKDRSDPEHIAAMERALHFKFGWWAHPLTTGDYPSIMRELIDAKSSGSESRLPTFDAEWTAMINGTLDFIGLNTYNSYYVLPSENNRWVDGDANIRTENDPAWNRSGVGWPVVPYGFRNILTWIHEEYKLPIYVTENGYGSLESEGLDDVGRQNYYRAYINEMLKSIVHDKADVRGYTAWSLMDNFEWMVGYTARFGVNYVDFNDPERPRTPKGSAILLKQLFADHGFHEPIQSTSSTETTEITSTTPTTERTTTIPSSAINIRNSFYEISLWWCLTCLMWYLK
ncbi:hypothetical protein HA402_000028 [Bradysia odoriphaga]|nr:hypothetical protein HA402_000028 [Bradysia odoriphaga]